jgi:hypothetical protein
VTTGLEESWRIHRRNAQTADMSCKQASSNESLRKLQPRYRRR